MLLVTKEALHNIVKHAHASEVLVAISCAEGLTISIIDNGIGIENQKKGLGLESINSRVKYLEGTIEIDSTTSGTLISISIPYKSKQL